MARDWKGSVFFIHHKPLRSSRTDSDETPTNAEFLFCASQRQVSASPRSPKVISVP